MVIHVLEFHHPMNNEERVSNNGDIQYCCCGTSNCQSQPFFFNMNNHNCGHQCDIYFVVSVYDGNSELPSTSTIMGNIQDSPSDSFYGYTFPFTLGNFPSLVRLKKCIIFDRLKMHAFVLFIITT